LNTLSNLCRSVLYSYPPIFDFSKRVSRAAGMRTPLYEALCVFRSKFPTARILQVGANDGLVNDPLREHILASQWICVLVEPVPYLFDKLLRNYRGLSRVSCINAAISDRDGEMDFYFIQEDALNRLPYWASQIGSFSIEHIQKHFGGIDDAWISKRKLRTIKIADLVAVIPEERFHLIHLDVEGHEAKLIKALLDVGHTPAAILFESHHLGEAYTDLETRLHRHGYELIRYGMDTLAMKGWSLPI
jgi:FkbM family methyltransferase